MPYGSRKPRVAWLLIARVSLMQLMPIKFSLILEGNLEFLRPARLELREIVRYYNAQLPHLGEEFRDEAWETVRRIKEFPLAWHPLGGAIRRCQMQRFPYGIIYEPSEVEIVLIAVAHLHREPEYWRS